MIWLIFIVLACSSRPASNTPGSDATEPSQIAQVMPFHQITRLECDDSICTIHTMTGSQKLDIKSRDVSAVETSEAPETAPTWALDSTPKPLAEQWNLQVSNTWRSPFRPEIPSPEGGTLRLVRGLSAHTSRVMRVGGKVMVTRQAPPPDNILYPRVMALHPTGQEGYLMVWPNPDLIAFQPNSLETTWRIRLDGPAVGLFVTRNGRYLVAEIGGTAPDHQLLDYEGGPVATPTGTDPIDDAAIPFLTRPIATHTVVVDLAEGARVARLPGSFVGFQLIPGGAAVASNEGISIIQSKTPANQ